MARLLRRAGRRDALSQDPGGSLRPFKCARRLHLHGAAEKGGLLGKQVLGSKPGLNKHKEEESPELRLVSGWVLPGKSLNLSEPGALVRGAVMVSAGQRCGVTRLQPCAFLSP